MAEPSGGRGRVLVVDDEPYVLESLGEVLRTAGFEPLLAPSADVALRLLGRAPVDVVLTDLRLAGMDGLELLKRAQSIAAEIPVLVLTGHGTIASAVECLRAGAADYILKPVDPPALEVALDRALSARALRSELQYLRASGRSTAPDHPLGISPAWLAVMRTVQAVAATDSTVLLLGESGTGKEMVGRSLHRLSRRAGAAYIRVNCAAVPMEMWESEFFGHRRGAFTGASGDREGRFRLAHRGTLFMDEIGAMPLPAQAKILRVLQDGEFDRLGDERPTRVDVRIIAATNSDLDADVEAGRFRRDLFYRFNVVRIELPPLRERRDDIPVLLGHFVEEISLRLGRRAPEVAADVIPALAAYEWPGNVRELRNVVERSLILATGPTLAAADLPILDGTVVAPIAGPQAAASSDLTLRSALAEREKALVIEALRRASGVRKEASRLLGIDQRNLPYYLRKHGIDADRPGE